MKKLLSLLVCFTLVINTIIPAFAQTDSSLEGDFEKLPEISEEALDQAIEQALQMQLAEIDDPKERLAYEQGVRHNLELLEDADFRPVFDIPLDPNQLVTDGLGDIWKKVVPDIHIKNKHVAGTISALITGVAIAAGAGSISLALKKYGATQLKRMFTKTLKKRVIGKAAIALGISIPTIAGFLDYVVDPAGKIADFIDSKDDDPNNGYFDVIW